MVRRIVEPAPKPTAASLTTYAQVITARVLVNERTRDGRSPATRQSDSLWWRRIESNGTNLQWNLCRISPSVHPGNVLVIDQQHYHGLRPTNREGRRRGHLTRWMDSSQSVRVPSGRTHTLGSTFNNPVSLKAHHTIYLQETGRPFTVIIIIIKYCNSAASDSIRVPNMPRRRPRTWRPPLPLLDRIPRYLLNLNKFL